MVSVPCNSSGRRKQLIMNPMQMHPSIIWRSSGKVVTVFASSCLVIVGHVHNRNDVTLGAGDVLIHANIVRLCGYWSSCTGLQGKYITLLYIFNLQTARAVVTARITNRRRRGTCSLAGPRHSCSRRHIASGRGLLHQHRDCGTGCELEDAVAEDCSFVSIRFWLQIAPSCCCPKFAGNDTYLLANCQSHPSDS